MLLPAMLTISSHNSNSKRAQNYMKKEQESTNIKILLVTEVLPPLWEEASQRALTAVRTVESNLLIRKLKAKIEVQINNH
jgi:hypothetical protein